MPLPDPRPVPLPVPFEELAAVLDGAIARASGGPARLIPVSGRILAASIEQAGLRVVRDAPPGRQLTL